MSLTPAMIVAVAAFAVAGCAVTKSPPTKATSTQPASTQPVGWQTTPAAQFILHPFEHAPYPHESRKDGYTHNDKKYPRDPHYTDSTVGIVIPTGYKPGDTVDYIVHFHGWENHVSKVITHYNLMPQLHAAKVNAILIVPQGPKDAPDSGGGKLESDPGAFAKLMDEVTAYLNKEGKIHTKKIGKIVLTTHSGGYKVTAAILHLGGMTDKITDVLLLDSSYGSLEYFTDYCKGDNDRRLVSLFTDHLADTNKEFMGDLDKASVKHKTLEEPQVKDKDFLPRTALFMHIKGPHDQVPNQYFGRLIATSALGKE